MSNFRIGEKVVCVDRAAYLEEGKIYEVMALGNYHGAMILPSGLPNHPSTCPSCGKRHKT